MYFESHAHYDDERFDADRDELLGLLPKEGIDFVVNAGADIKSSEAGIAFSEKYDYFYAAVGVHPHEAKSLSEEGFMRLKELSKHKKVVAIGEIGLDFYYDNSPRDIQRKWFKAQLELAKEENLPVIIHSREAAAECFDMIKESGVRQGVIHCYSGSPEMAADYVKMGFYIGIGGVITYKNAKKLLETAKAIPISRILLETDCPYLSPAQKRGERNDSRNLKFVVAKLSELLEKDPSEIAKITSENARKLFFK